MQSSNNRNSLVKKLSCFFLILTLILFSCTKTAQKESAETKDSLHDKKEKELENTFYCWDLFIENLEKTNYIKKEDSLPKKAIPWGGTVSHHLLTDKQIDEWFKELAEHRPSGIDLFFVLSPSHWNLSLETWSLTDGSWKCKGGYVDSNITEVEKLKKLLNVEYEPFVFNYEHGVSTLMPFIKKYFPKAEVLVVAYNGEPPVNMKTVRKFERAIQKVFSIEQAENEKNAFLLISTDFSHHSNLARTKEKDAKSRAFLENINYAPWILGICDNRPAMFLLSELATKETKTTIQYHTNAFELTNKTAPDDITSYFFSFFWEDK